MSATFLLTDADLHGLVDGQIEPSRRGDVLRRVAASPADRARIEAWQDQNALIKSAFLGLDKEPLPASLKLVPPPALQFVPAAEPGFVASSRKMPAARRTTAFASGVVGLLAVCGLAASWTLLQSGQDDPQPIDLRLRGTVDETLADQAAGAVDLDRLGQSRPTRVSRPSAGAALPTAEIPDLTSAGFVFTSAEAKPSVPRSLVFHYQDASANRIAVSVARAPLMDADTGPTQIGRSFSWHHGENAFAIAGTVRPERLRAMATLLQGDGEQ